MISKWPAYIIYFQELSPPVEHIEPNMAENNIASRVLEETHPFGRGKEIII